MSENCRGDFFDSHCRTRAHIDVCVGFVCAEAQWHELALCQCSCS